MTAGTARGVARSEPAAERSAGSGASVRPGALIRVRAILAAVVIGLSIAQIIWSVVQLPSQPPDTEAYWQAALRLRAGEPLYQPADELLARDVYRYAPWFAYAWVPLTYLPRETVDVGWKLLMVGATVVAVLPLLLRRTLVATAAAAVLGWLTVQTALFGNVHPLLIAGLVWTVDRRTGPVWIAIAASLKFVPILYVVVYVARREFRRALLALGLTAALLAPMLAFDLSGYTTTPGTSASLFSLHPLLWAAVAAVAIAATAVVAARRSPYSWVVASAAVYLAYPQAFISYASHLLVGTRPPSADAGDRPR